MSQLTMLNNTYVLTLRVALWCYGTVTKLFCVNVLLNCYFIILCSSIPIVSLQGGNLDLLNNIDHFTCAFYYTISITLRFNLSPKFIHLGISFISSPNSLVEFIPWTNSFTLKSHPFHIFSHFAMSFSSRFHSLLYSIYFKLD